MKDEYDFSNAERGRFYGKPMSFEGQLVETCDLCEEKCDHVSVCEVCGEWVCEDCDVGDDEGCLCVRCDDEHD